MDVPSGNSGNDYLTDFPGDIIRIHEQEGFHFIARHCIWKEPLAVRNRTMQKNLVDCYSRKRFHLFRCRIG